VASCEKNEECTKTRLAASDVWKEVQDKAGKWKLHGALGYDDFDERQKGEHYKAWNAIETGAEDIWKAFAFEKITWDSADRAHDQVNKGFRNYWAADKYASFAALLQGANKRYDETTKVCK
jgi:hypothetical protein